MNRRQFIITACAGTTVLLVPSLVSGCASQSLALKPWSGPAPDIEDIRIRLLSYAILAPNPHNIQAWLLDLSKPEVIDLYVDPDRLLPETDPPFRQIHIGQGTFLEVLDIAARELGYQAKIDYFPQGMYSNTTLENKPVASVELIKKSGMEKSPLLDHILLRRSNKRVYDPGVALTENQINSMLNSYDTGEYPLKIEADPRRLKRLAEIMTRAMEVEISDEERHKETLNMFRFNSEEVEKYRDGFGLAQLGITGIDRWFVERFILGSREAATPADSTFARNTIDLVRRQAESSSAIAWITSKTNTRLDQVKIGRAYVRSNLTATDIGLAQHPMSQVIQEYTEMSGLQGELLDFLEIPKGHTVQMLFRLGNAEPAPPASRREIADMLVRKGRS